MGRHEEPLDPSNGPVQQFAHDLRQLREAAGSPSYRQLAAGAHFSATALSTAARGVVLPSWAVTRAFVLACGGDEGEWRRRWEDTAALLAPATRQAAARPAGYPHPAAAPGEDAEHLPARQPQRPTPSAVPGDAVTGRTRARKHRARWMLAGLVMAGGILVGFLIRPALAPASSPGRLGAGNAVEPGHDCAPDGIIAPAASASAATAARIRMDFEPGSLIWGPYWNADNVHERLVDTDPYQGRTALEVRVGGGFGAIGTVHIDGLRPESTLRLHIWYGGQGQGMICPFVQDTGSTIEWVPVAPLTLHATTRPGWRAYEWTMPEVDIHGVGLQLTNTGANDLVIRIDSAEW